MPIDSIPPAVPQRDLFRAAAAAGDAARGLNVVRAGERGHVAVRIDHRHLPHLAGRVAAEEAAKRVGGGLAGAEKIESELGRTTDRRNSAWPPRRRPPPPTARSARPRTSATARPRRSARLRIARDDRERVDGAMLREEGQRAEDHQQQFLHEKAFNYRDTSTENTSVSCAAVVKRRSPAHRPPFTGSTADMPQNPPYLAAMQTCNHSSSRNSA